MHAAEVLNQARDQYAPGWVPSRDTVLGTLLSTSAQPAVCEAIALAWSLRVVAAALTERSLPIFAKKVGELFAERSDVQFDERRTELEVAELLAARVSPIAFEPYVPSEGDPPPSADYAISLPEGSVAIDVTVVHVDAFEAWARAVRQLVDGLRTRIDSEGKFVAVELAMPLEFDRTRAQVLLERRTLSPLLKSNEGSLFVDVGAEVQAELRWSPLPVLVPGEGIQTLPQGAFAAVQAPPSSVGSGSAFNYRPVGGGSDAERLAFTSLRRTLQRKKKQFEGKPEPPVLVLKSAHHWLTPEGLLDLLERRVWPNGQYAWLTAACVLFPRRSFVEASPDNQSRLVSTLNTGPHVAASPSLRSLLAGERAFHLRNGRYEER